MFLRKIRIRDVNRYLRPVVSQLKKKHLKVSSAEFSDELESITGIRYRMAKTYLYNSNPWQEVKDNAKIKHFVLKQRQKDLVYKLQAPSLFLILVGLFLFGAFKLYKSLQQKVIVRKEVIHKTKIYQKPPAKLIDIQPSGIEVNIPDIGLVIDAGLHVKTLKSLKDAKAKLECEHVPPSKGDGRDDFTVCSYTTVEDYFSSEPRLNLSFVYNRTNKKIYQYNVDSTIPKYVKILKIATSRLNEHEFKLVDDQVIEKFRDREDKTVQRTYKNKNYYLTIMHVQLSEESQEILEDIDMTGSYKIMLNAIF